MDAHMEPMTLNDFQDLLNGPRGSYYTGRWEYFKVVNANYPAHHLIDEELINDWTLQVHPEEVVKIPRTGPEVSKGPRIIYFWIFP
jgi:hypothetical protein